MGPAHSRKRAKQPTTDSELASAASLDAASDFTAPTLAALDHSLRCPICAELFTAPVILTACSHSFDSRCLRHYLASNKRCPSCLQETTEDRIRVNLALQGTVAAWKDARYALSSYRETPADPFRRRADLLRLQAAASPSPAPQAGPSSPTPTAPTSTTFAPARRTPSAAAKGKRKASALSASSSSTVKPEPREAILLDDEGSSDVEIIEDAGPSSTSKRPPRKKVKGVDGAGRGSTKGTGRAKELEAADPTDPSLILECPLCGGSIKNALMASHVERCNGVPPTGNTSAAWGKLLGAGSGSGGGGGGKSGESESSMLSTRDKKLDTTQHLPLASYQHKTVAELTEMLKAYNLPTALPASASKDPLSTEAKLALLTRRHRHFLVLWNANADLAADDPAHKSAQGVRDELARWEKTQDMPPPAGEEAGGRAHLSKYAADFREHIARARASAQAAKQKQAAQQAQDPPRPSTPPPAVPPAAAAAATAADELPAPPAAARKRSVRVVSPARSSPPPPPPPADARSSRAPSSASSSPPPLPSRADSPTRAAPAQDGDEEEGRSLSPFDAERMPRASQRNREEERMFAEKAAREEERELAGEEESGSEEEEGGAA
ncbi:E3 ubiquitin-protein ligase rad18 [Rhodotorula kratochvilovae]